MSLRVNPVNSYIVDDRRRENTSSNNLNKEKGLWEFAELIKEFNDLRSRRRSMLDRVPPVIITFKEVRRTHHLLSLITVNKVYCIASKVGIAMFKFSPAIWLCLDIASNYHSQKENALASALIDGMAVCGIRFGTGKAITSLLGKGAALRYGFISFGFAIAPDFLELADTVSSPLLRWPLRGLGAIQWSFNALDPQNIFNDPDFQYMWSSHFPIRKLADSSPLLDKWGCQQYIGALDFHPAILLHRFTLSMNYMLGVKLARISERISSWEVNDATWPNNISDVIARHELNLVGELWDVCKAIAKSPQAEQFARLMLLDAGYLLNGDDSKWPNNISDVLARDELELVGKLGNVIAQYGCELVGKLGDVCKASLDSPQALQAARLMFFDPDYFLDNELGRGLGSTERAPVFHLLRSEQQPHDPFWNEIVQPYLQSYFTQGVNPSELAPKTSTLPITFEISNQILHKFSFLTQEDLLPDQDWSILRELTFEQNKKAEESQERVERLPYVNSTEDSKTNDSPSAPPTEKVREYFATAHPALHTTSSEQPQMSFWEKAEIKSVSFEAQAAGGAALVMVLAGGAKVSVGLSESSLVATATVALENGILSAAATSLLYAAPIAAVIIVSKLLLDAHCERIDKNIGKDCERSQRDLEKTRNQQVAIGHLFDKLANGEITCSELIGSLNKISQRFSNRSYILRNRGNYAYRNGVSGSNHYAGASQIRQLALDLRRNAEYLSAQQTVKDEYVSELQKQPTDALFARLDSIAAQQSVSLVEQFQQKALVQEISVRAITTGDVDVADRLAARIQTPAALSLDLAHVAKPRHPSEEDFKGHRKKRHRDKTKKWADKVARLFKDFRDIVRDKSKSLEEVEAAAQRLLDKLDLKNKEDPKLKEYLLRNGKTAFDHYDLFISLIRSETSTALIKRQNLENGIVSAITPSVISRQDSDIVTFNAALKSFQQSNKNLEDDSISPEQKTIEYGKWLKSAGILFELRHLASDPETVKTLVAPILSVGEQFPAYESYLSYTRDVERFNKALEVYHRSTDCLLDDSASPEQKSAAYEERGSASETLLELSYLAANPEEFKSEINSFLQIKDKYPSYKSYGIALDRQRDLQSCLQEIASGMEELNSITAVDENVEKIDRIMATLRSKAKQFEDSNPTKEEIGALLGSPENADALHQNMNDEVAKILAMSIEWTYSRDMPLIYNPLINLGLHILSDLNRYEAYQSLELPIGFVMAFHSYAPEILPTALTLAPASFRGEFQVMSKALLKHAYRRTAEPVQMMSNALVTTRDVALQLWQDPQATKSRMLDGVITTFVDTSKSLRDDPCKIFPMLDTASDTIQATAVGVQLAATGVQLTALVISEVANRVFAEHKNIKAIYSKMHAYAAYYTQLGDKALEYWCKGKLTRNFTEINNGIASIANKVIAELKNAKAICSKIQTSKTLGEVRDKSAVVSRAAYYSQLGHKALEYWCKGELIRKSSEIINGIAPIITALSFGGYECLFTDLEIQNMRQGSLSYRIKKAIKDKLWCSNFKGSLPQKQSYYIAKDLTISVVAGVAAIALAGIGHSQADRAVGALLCHIGSLIYNLWSKGYRDQALSAIMMSYNHCEKLKQTLEEKQENSIEKLEQEQEKSIKELEKCLQESFKVGSSDSAITKHARAFYFDNSVATLWEKGDLQELLRITRFTRDKEKRLVFVESGCEISSALNILFTRFNAFRKLSLFDLNDSSVKAICDTERSKEYIFSDLISDAVTELEQVEAYFKLKHIEAYFNTLNENALQEIVEELNEIKLFCINSFFIHYFNTECKNGTSTHWILARCFDAIPENQRNVFHWHNLAKAIKKIGAHFKRLQPNSIETESEFMDMEMTCHFTIIKLPKLEKELPLYELYESIRRNSKKIFKLYATIEGSFVPGRKFLSDLQEAYRPYFVPIDLDITQDPEPSEEKVLTEEEMFREMFPEDEGSWCSVM